MRQYTEPIYLKLQDPTKSISYMASRLHCSNCLQHSYKYYFFKSLKLHPCKLCAKKNEKQLNSPNSSLSSNQKLPMNLHALWVKVKSFQSTTSFEVNWPNSFLSLSLPFLPICSLPSRHSSYSWTHRHVSNMWSLPWALPLPEMLFWQIDACIIHLIFFTSLPKSLFSETYLEYSM